MKTTLPKNKIKSLQKSLFFFLFDMTDEDSIYDLIVSYIDAPEGCGKAEDWEEEYELIEHQLQECFKMYGVAMWWDKHLNASGLKSRAMHIAKLTKLHTEECTKCYNHCFNKKN